MYIFCVLLIFTFTLFAPVLRASSVWVRLHMRQLQLLSILLPKSYSGRLTDLDICTTERMTSSDIVHEVILHALQLLYTHNFNDSSISNVKVTCVVVARVT
jgi:hypothetical protein